METPTPLPMLPAAVPSHLPAFDASTIRVAPPRESVCEHCHWWHIWNKHPVGKTLGDCHYRPPIVVVDQATGKPMNRRATTRATDDCGHWRPRAETTPATP